MSQQIPPADPNFGKGDMKPIEEENEFDEQSFRDKMEASKKKIEERTCVQEEIDSEKSTSMDSNNAAREASVAKEAALNDEDVKMEDQADQLAENKVNQDLPTLSLEQKHLLKQAHEENSNEKQLIREEKKLNQLIIESRESSQNQTEEDQPAIEAVACAWNPFLDPPLKKERQGSKISGKKNPKSPSVQAVDQEEDTSEDQEVLQNLPKDYEQLAFCLLSEAEVLQDGEVTETTIDLNLEGTVFTGGRIKITTHKYRPLEVNISISNLSPKAKNALEKNGDKLKKVLKRKSLKVHQLEIVE